MLSSFLKTVSGKFLHVGNTELTFIYAPLILSFGGALNRRWKTWQMAMEKPRKSGSQKVFWPAERFSDIVLPKNYNNNDFQPQ